MNSAFAEWWIGRPSLFGVTFHFWTGVVFILGAFVGSFLNVCIHRMPLGMSVVSPPSHCPHCQYRIPALLNIPIITWLWLRGKCAHCGAAISPRYLGVEVLTALTFTGLWLAFGEAQPGVALAYCVLFSGFIVATFIDFDHLIIPDEITIGGAFVGFVLAGIVPEMLGETVRTEAMLRSGTGIAVGAGVVFGVVQFGKLLFGREKVPVEPGTRVVFHEEGIVLPDRVVPFDDLFFRQSDTVRLKGEKVELADRCYPVAEVALSPKRLRVGPDELVPAEEPYLAAITRQLVLPREAMGLGDVKFMATIGAFLGWRATLFSLGAASMLGAIVGVTLIAIGRREWSSRLPFGPYLTAGAILWIAGASRWWERFFGG